MMNLEQKKIQIHEIMTKQYLPIRPKSTKPPVEKPAPLKLKQHRIKKPSTKVKSNFSD
jgi:hypothetical protein